MFTITRLLVSFLLLGRRGDSSSSTSIRSRGNPSSVGDIQGTARSDLSNGDPNGGSGDGNGNNGDNGNTDDLPPGWRYDDNGRLRDENGDFARHPDAPPRDYDRNQYPSGYRTSTHDYMVRNFTVEGQRDGEWPTREVTQPDGTTKTEKIPREELSWVDEDGEEIPYYYTDRHGDQQVNVTYDHNPPVVEHWNTGGNNMDQAGRNDWYNKTEGMTAVSVSDNSSKGGTGTDGQRQTYTQDVGPNYKKRGE